MNSHKESWAGMKKHWINTRKKKHHLDFFFVVVAFTGGPFRSTDGARDKILFIFFLYIYLVVLTKTKNRLCLEYFAQFSVCIEERVCRNGFSFTRARSTT